MIDHVIDLFSFVTKFCRDHTKPLCHIDQKILHCSNFRFLSTDAGFRTSCAACCFLTLKTKHFIFHGMTLLVVDIYIFFTNQE